MRCLESYSAVNMVRKVNTSGGNVQGTLVAHGLVFELLLKIYQEYRTIIDIDINMRHNIMQILYYLTPVINLYSEQLKFD